MPEDQVTEEQLDEVEVVEDNAAAPTEESDNSGEIITRLSNRRDDLALENAKLRAVLAAFDADLDIDAELNHVVGLTVDKGKVDGKVAYRRAAQQTQKTASAAPPIRRTSRGSKAISDMSHSELMDYLQKEQKSSTLEGLL